MTIYVTEPTARGRMSKPQPVIPRYAQGDMLHWLIAQHPEAIYFTDNEAEFFGSTDVSVVDHMSTIYELWERDLHNPHSLPRKSHSYGNPARDRAEALEWVRLANEGEAYRGRYQYFAMKVVTTVVYDEVGSE